MVLVNIRGCNGSGKSTIPLSMMCDPDMYVYVAEYNGKQLKIATVFPNYSWVALGTYFNKTGGMDLFRGNDIIKFAIMEVLSKFKEYDIIMEGVIASTVRSTYINLFKEIELLYPDRKIIILSIIPPIEVCVQRVKERNGGKEVIEKYIFDKWKVVDRNVDHFKNEGFISLRVNSAKVKKENMLKAFNKTIDKYRN